MVLINLGESEAVLEWGPYVYKIPSGGTIQNVNSIIMKAFMARYPDVFIEDEAPDVVPVVNLVIEEPAPVLEEQIATTQPFVDQMNALSEEPYDVLGQVNVKRRRGRPRKV